MATPKPTGGAGASGGAAGDKGGETTQISRFNLNQLKNQEQIIHRTQNCIIVAGQIKKEDAEPVSYKNLNDQCRRTILYFDKAVFIYSYILG